MKSFARWMVLVAVLAFVMGVTSAVAKDKEKWHKVDVYTVSGKNSRIIAVKNLDIAKLRFFVEEGSVIINGGAITAADGRSSFKVAQRIEKDKSVDVDIDKTNVVQIIIAEDGGGKYALYRQ